MKDAEIISGYSTAQEKEFLSGLGSFSIAGPYLDKARLLKNYIAASGRRAVWGKISRHEIVAFAKKKLAEIEAEVDRRWRRLKAMSEHPLL